MLERSFSQDVELITRLHPTALEFLLLESIVVGIVEAIFSHPTAKTSMKTERLKKI